MNFKSLYRDIWLLTNFSNGWQMVRTLRGAPSVFYAQLLNGRCIVHPSDKVGLVEAILEIWFEKAYFPNNFYSPKSDDIIVDIGANIGLFTLQIARMNVHCRIAAFEPFPENFECLSRNVSNFCLENTTVHQYAISDHFGQDFIVETGSRSLDHQLSKKSEIISNISNYTSVNVIPLEGIFDIIKCQKISFLKMDIEGSEKEVFESTSEKTLKRVGRLALEYHDHLRPGTLDLIVDRLTSTHSIKTIPSNLPGCGLLFAMRKV